MPKQQIALANSLIDCWLRPFIHGRPSLAYATYTKGLFPKITNEYFLSTFAQKGENKNGSILVERLPELCSTEAATLDMLEEKNLLYIHNGLLRRMVDDSSVVFQSYVQLIPGVREECLFIALPVYRTSDIAGFRKQLITSFEQSEEAITETDRRLLRSLILDKDLLEFQKGVLEENRARMAAMLNAVSDGIIGVDHDASIRMVNPAILSQWGYERAELIGKNVGILFEEGEGMNQLPALLDLERDSLPHDIVRTVQTMAVRADGGVFPVEVAINRVDHPGSVSFVAVVRDVSEQHQQKRKQEQLLAEVNSSKVRLATLSNRLVIALEEERRRIALDLHDDLGSRIAMINMGLRNIRNQVNDRAVKRLDSLEIQVQEIAGILRRLSGSLRPKILDDYGLLEACDWLVSNFEKESGIRVDFAWSGIGRDDRFSGLTEIVAFRIIQESLTNISKHAMAKECLLRLTVLDDTILLSVIDQGLGFDVNKAMTEGDTVGLIGMKERIHQMNGEFTVESKKGEGTQVLVEIPIAPLEKEILPA